MPKAAYLETTSHAYKEIASERSWPSTTSSPPSSSDLDSDVSRAGMSIEQVLFHLSYEAPTPCNTVSSPAPLPRSRIRSRAKPFVPRGAVSALATESVTILPRTRVSALAKPFVPGSTGITSCSHRWGHYESMFAGGAAYSEEAQEAAYLLAASTAATPNMAYDESLQEEVYLRVRVPSRTPSPVRLHWDSKPVYPEASESQAKELQMYAMLSNSGMKSLGLGRPNAQQQWQQQHGQHQQKLSVKRTFIHYDDLQESSMDREASAAKQRSASAPGILHNQCLQHFEKARAHQRGQCRPCAYYFFKADGCRNAADCKFCHICPQGEAKRRKKEKRDQMKLRKTQALETVVVDENVDPMTALMPERSE